MDDRKASVIDVWAAALVDDLPVRGFGDVTVLDISELALAQAKAGLAESAAKGVEGAQQDAYIAALTAATEPGATVIIISIFDLEGPERRSLEQRFSLPCWNGNTCPALGVERQ